MGIANEAAQVSVRLVLDSNAQAESEKIAAGLKQVEGHAQKHASGWKEMMTGAFRKVGELVTTEGLSIVKDIAGLPMELGRKATEAYGEAAAQIKNTAAALATIDTNANSMKNLKVLAEDVKDQMEEIGIRAGVSSEAAQSAFDAIISRGGKTIDQTADLIDKMSLAGKVVPGGIEAISGGFEMIELGMVRAKNPIVQLISATGTLKGSAKSVAKEMQKMSIDKQMELAEKAIERMADKAKQMPLSLKGMKEGISIITGNFWEKMGAPINAALSPLYSRVRSIFVDNQDAIYEMGAKLGESLSKGIEIIGPFIDVTRKVLTDMAAEVQQAMDNAFGPGMDLFTYIYENKEAFAQTFGDILRLIVKTAEFLMGAIKKVSEYVNGLFKGMAFVAGQGQYVAEEEQKAQAGALRKEVMSKGALSGDDLSARKAAYMKSSKDMGMGEKEVQAAGEQFDRVYMSALQGHLGVMQQVQGLQTDNLQYSAKNFAQAYNVAQKAGDTAAMQYVAKFLENNAMLQNALAKEGPAMFSDGMKGLLDTL